MESPNGLPIVYVGRGSEWGNPFVIGKDGTVEECIEKYLDHIMPYRDRGKNIGMAKPYLWEMSLAYIREKLGGKNLACWCALDKPCHADVLLKITKGAVMTTFTPEEEAMLTQEYAEYMAWCRKWIAPPTVSYEDFWRMAADDAKDDAKYD